LKKIKLRIREVFKRIHKKNPISGHEWTEHGPTIGYEIAGPCGVESKYKTEKAALDAAAKSQAFYDKFLPCGSYACAGIRLFEKEL
jgi:hypothetical protein